MSGSLAGKRVLVIGRAGGIAESVALMASEEGAETIVAGRHRQELAAHYEQGPVAIETVDVVDRASVVGLAARLGRVDHIVSTASARARGTLEQLDAAAVLASLETKVVGPLLLAQAFASTLSADGSMVLLSGASAKRPLPGMLAVAATNAAVDVLVQGMAVELAPIRVNAIAPGTIDTGAYDALGADRKVDLFATRARFNPARRIGTAQDVAAAVIFAVRSTFMTGVTLRIDGGEPLS